MTKDEQVLFQCAEMLHGADKLGFPCVLKIAMGGYDGNGQWKFHNRRELLLWIVSIFRDQPGDADIKEFEEFYTEKLPLHDAIRGTK